MDKSLDTVDITKQVQKTTWIVFVALVIAGIGWFAVKKFSPQQAAVYDGNQTQDASATQNAGTEDFGGPPLDMGGTPPDGGGAPPDGGGGPPPGM